MFLSKLLSLLSAYFGLTVGLECGQFTNYNNVLTERIVGGDNAALGEFPWQVSMQRQTGSRIPRANWIPAPAKWPSPGTWSQWSHSGTPTATYPTPTPPGGWPTYSPRPIHYPPGQSQHKPNPVNQKPTPGATQPPTTTTRPQTHPQPHPQPSPTRAPTPSVTTGKWMHFCGGSIISENWILTAAHCVENNKYNYKPGSIRIVLGTVDWRNSHTGNSQIISIERVFVHDGWNRQTGQNDIALLQTSTPIQFTKGSDGTILANKVCLSKDPNVEYSGEALSSGWGYLSKNSRVSPDMLRKVKLPVVDHNTCRNAFSKVIDVTPKQVCAGQSPKGNCMGDSGGPLVQMNGNKAIQIGIVSFSIPCAVAGYPDVFTKVSRYIDWINQHSNNAVNVMG